MVAQVSEEILQPCTSQQVWGMQFAHMGGKPDILLVEGTLFQGNEGEGMQDIHHNPYHRRNYPQLSARV